MHLLRTTCSHREAVRTGEKPLLVVAEVDAVSVARVGRERHCVRGVRTLALVGRLAPQPRRDDHGQHQPVRLVEDVDDAQHREEDQREGSDPLVGVGRGAIRAVEGVAPRTEVLQPGLLLAGVQEHGVRLLLVQRLGLRVPYEVVLLVCRGAIASRDRAAIVGRVVGHRLLELRGRLPLHLRQRGILLKTLQRATSTCALGEGLKLVIRELVDPYL